MLAAIGIIEKAKLFPYLLSMGDLRHPCDSCYRCEQFIKCLSEYCTDCKSQAKKLWEKYHTTEDIIQDAMMNQKSLRIWVRNTSECWCGIYYICFCAAKRHSANISLASTEDLKKVLEFKGDQISEKTLSSEDIAEYAQKWEKLLRENKPLRIWRTNEVRSVEDSLFTVQETEFKPQSPALLPQIDTSEIQPETFVMHPPKSATQALASFAHKQSFLIKWISLNFIQSYIAASE